MNDWNIQSRGRACEACGKSFADKEPYHTLLFDEKQDFRRSDVCAACWQTQFSDGARERKGFISYWQGVYEAPAPVTEAIQKDTAESLLRKLITLDDPRYIPAAFILAVMLERKRLLKVKEQLVRDGHRLFIYEHPASGDVFTIVDPDLHLYQLQQVQHDVAALLEHGLNPPPPTDAAADSAAQPGPVSQEGEPESTSAAEAAAPVPEPTAS